ncbi:MAG: alkaline phosphatase family protein, partial [Anaerolineales bacterium]|nr:alkaline phosphatase family protein [Anaerolineales bacterium]
MAARSKVLIIGLDGASPALVERWRGSLPNLGRLIDGGVSGTLRSVNPPRSIPAWYCFATGMNPAKIGVFGFSQRIPGTYDYTFANLSFCRMPPFWIWLNLHGVKTAVVHVPGTYPPQPVDGMMVSGWPAPVNRGNLAYTHPPELGRTIDRHLGRPFEFLSPAPMLPDNDRQMLEERLRIINVHGETARTALKRGDWQAGVVVFSPLDRASHQFWRHIDPSHPAHEPAQAEQFEGALRQVYQACDGWVGRLLELLTPDDTVFIVSDHGFGPARRIFYLNEWLQQEGYLVLEKSEARGGSVVGRLATPLFALNETSPIFRRLTGPLKKRALSNFLRDEYVHHRHGSLVRLNHLPVDWGRTRAYCPDEGALYLNLNGRDPQGSVEPGAEAEALIREIVHRLGTLTDPLTGQPIDLQVHHKGHVYSGPYLDDAPELLITVDGYATEVMAEMGGGSLFASSP